MAKINPISKLTEGVGKGDLVLLLSSEGTQYPAFYNYSTKQYHHFSINTNLDTGNFSKKEYCLGCDRILSRRGIHIPPQK